MWRRSHDISGNLRGDGESRSLTEPNHNLSAESAPSNYVAHHLLARRVLSSGRLYLSVPWLPNLLRFTLGAGHCCAIPCESAMEQYAYDVC